MNIRDLAIGAALMCLWGFNFSVIRLGVNEIDPLLLVALRFLFAVVPLIFFIPKPDVPWRYLVAYGLCFGVGLWGMVTWSIEAGVSSGMASLLMQMSVVASIALGVFYFKETVNMGHTLGAGLALVGLGLIIYYEVLQEDSIVSPLGLLLGLIGALAWALNGAILKMSRTRAVFAYNLWSMLFAPLPLVLLAWAFRGGEIFLQFTEQLNGRTWFSVLFQAYPTTLLGYWLWNRLIVKYSLSVVAPLTLLVPLFAMLGGWLFYREEVSLTQMAAAIFILSGLFVSQRSWQVKTQTVPGKEPRRAAGVLAGK